MSSMPLTLLRLYVQFRFRDGIEKQFMALQKGFHELIPPHLLKDFDERELELLISGLGKVDVDDWRANTRLKNCSPDTDTIKWFWKVSHSPIHYCMYPIPYTAQAVESYDDEKRARLLQFVTGSSRVPLGGFKALQGQWDTTIQPLWRLTLSSLQGPLGLQGPDCSLSILWTNQL